MSQDREERELPELGSRNVAMMIRDTVALWEPHIDDDSQSHTARMWRTLFEVSSLLSVVVDAHFRDIDNSPEMDGPFSDEDPLLTRLSSVFAHLVGLNDISRNTLMRVGGDLSTDLQSLGLFLESRLPPRAQEDPNVRRALGLSQRINSQFEMLSRRIQVHAAEARARALLNASADPENRAKESTASNSSRTIRSVSRSAATGAFKRTTSGGSESTSAQSGRVNLPARGSLWENVRLLSTKTAGNELTKHFDTFAESNGTAALIYRANAIFLTACVLGVAIWTYLQAPPEDTVALLWRSSLLVGSIGLAAYLARQGALHHELATWAKTIAVQLSTFESYLASIEDEETVAELRQRFAHRVFMSQPVGIRHARGKINLQSVIDGAGDVLKNSRP